MAWRETCPMKERMKFIMAHEQNDCGFSHLCRGFNISRKTGYKWLNRYEDEGFDGLEDRSRAPLTFPNQISEVQARMILAVKYDHPHWGPRKIIMWLSQEYKDTKWPAISTAGELLKRHGLVKPRKKRKRVPPYTQPFGACESPNDSWSIDYKGQFNLANGQLCYPLTITDNYSRYLLACDAYKQISGMRVKTVLEKLFKEYGLPAVIRSDNGSPFASRGLSGLSTLSVWWVKLGVLPERIRPGKPQENGRHERMHRTLKQETTHPVENDMFSQQLAFSRFQHEYNDERPHEGIGDQRPSWLYEASRRAYPYHIEEMEYGSEYTCRKIRTNGTMKWGGREVFISGALCGERIGLLPVSDKEWKIYYATLAIGTFNEETGKVSSA